MESEIIDPKDCIFSQKEENFTLKQEFKIFNENSLDTIAHPPNIALMDLSKISHKPMIHDMIEGNSYSSIDNPFKKLNPKDDLSPHARSFLNAAYSPATFYLPNMNSSQQNMNTSNNNEKSNQEFGLTPIRNLSKIPDDYYSHYDAPMHPPDLHPARALRLTSDCSDNFGDLPLGLMWGQDNLKSNKQSLTIPSDLFKRQISFGPGFIPPTYDNEEESHDEEKSKDHGGISHSKLFGLKYEQENENLLALPRENFADFAGKLLKTPVKRKNTEENNITCRSTAASKSQIQREQREEDALSPVEEDEAVDPKQRSSRGLRVLSIKVKDVVAEKKKTTYKEVADTLIEEFTQKNLLRKAGDAKEEQNVKRRVYDALNVLIAADILTKDGKYVICDDSFVNLGPDQKKKLKEQKESTDYRLKQVKKRTKRKIEVIQDLMFKYLAMKNLIAKNKNRLVVETMAAKDQKTVENTNDSQQGVKDVSKIQKEENSQSAKKSIKTKVEEMESIKKELESPREKPKANTKSDEVIPFPFVVLQGSAAENELNLHMDPSHTNLSIDSKTPLHMYGDIDILLKMKLHYVSKRFFEENIPQEARKYVSDKYAEDN